MINQTIKKRRIIFPIMLVFLVLYILASPEKIVERTLLFRNQSPKSFPGVAEKDIRTGKDIKEKHVEGELIIKFALPTNFDQNKTGITKIDAISQKYSLEFAEKLKLSSSDRIYKIKIANDQDLKKAIQEYSKISEVEWVEPNYKAQMTVTNPDDPKYQDGTQWALNQIADHDIDAPEGWDLETGSVDTVIGIIDSGVDLDHKDLDANIWNNAGEVGGGKENNSVDDDGNGYVDDYQGWDWVTSYNNAPADNDPNPEPDGINNDGWYGVDDGVTHGSHVAGIASAETNNATGIAGVCWSCKIMALRVLDDEGWGDYDDVVEAIEYATDNGADVINMSLAGGYSQVLDESVAYAYKNDVVIVAAASNESMHIKKNPLSPVCNDGSQNMVIGVSATTSADKLASYSNYGAPYVDVSAPGSSIYSTLYTDDPAHGFTTDYGYMSGTSMASPHVAGLAALVKSAHPTWSGPEVRDRAIDLTNNIDNLNTSYTYQIGSGRINIERALNSSNSFYPSGTPLKVAGISDIYIISNGHKRKIISKVFREFYFNDIYDIVYVSSDELKKYPLGPQARFPDGTIVGAKRSGRFYLLDERHLRKLGRWPKYTTMMSLLGYSSKYIRWSYYEYTKYPVGANMTSSFHPSGAVVTANGGVNSYLIDIYLKDEITSGFEEHYLGANKEVSISMAELNTYTAGDTLRYPNGILLGDNGSGNIYYIEYGLKRQFTNEAQLIDMGYRSDNIHWDDVEAGNYANGQAMVTP